LLKDIGHMSHHAAPEVIVAAGKRGLIKQLPPAREDASDPYYLRASQLYSAA
jgi:hypothetical protein